MASALRDPPDVSTTSWDVFEDVLGRAATQDNSGELAGMGSTRKASATRAASSAWGA
jgi:hypothetical protein